MPGPGGRPREYDAAWTRRGQRWPLELLDRIDRVARRLGTNREHLVVGIVEEWMNDFEKVKKPESDQGTLL